MRQSSKGGRLFFLTICGITGWLLTGCNSPQRKAEERLPELQLAWQTNYAAQRQLEARTIGWHDAVSQMVAHNIKLRRGRNDITNQQENVRQVFKDLIPTLNLRAGISERFGDLSAMTFDDVRFSADSFLNLPGIANFNTRLFASRLGLLRAQLLYNLAEREQVIQLYRLFLTAQELDATEKDLQAEEILANGIVPIDELAGRVLLEELRLRRLSLSRELAGFQESAGDMLGDRGYQWRLALEGMPNLDYAQNPLDLEDTNRVAQAQMKAVALELVAAWATIRGIKLQYWPELTVFVTGPPLYERFDGRERFWDFEDVRLTADLFWRIDTRGYVSRQLRQTRREQELQLERLQQEAISLIRRLLNAQELERNITFQIQQLDDLLPILEQAPPGQDYAGILKAIETNRSMRDQQRKLRRELAELHTLFWFVDEEKWKG